LPQSTIIQTILRFWTITNISRDNITGLTNATNGKSPDSGVHLDGFVGGQAVSTLTVDTLSASSFVLYWKGTFDGNSNATNRGNLIGSLVGVSPYVAGNYGISVTDDGSIQFESETGAGSIVTSTAIANALDGGDVTTVICSVDTGTEAVKIYVNGVLEVDETVVGLSLGATSDFRVFGNRDSTNTTTFAHPVGICYEAGAVNTTLTDDLALDLHDQGLGTFIADNASLSFTPAYLFDEGVGYQLHDLNGEYDALLDENGYVWSEPKNLGYIRDRGVDAFNGPTHLLDSSRPIVPDECFFTFVGVRNNNGGFISDMTIESSNTFSEVPLATCDMGGDRLATADLTGSPEKLPSYENVVVSSTDPDATNLDFYIHYSKTPIV
jgi:hypothetical protein